MPVRNEHVAIANRGDVMTRGGALFGVVAVVAALIAAQHAHNAWYINTDVAHRACAAEGGAVRYINARDGENALHGYKFVEYTFQCYTGEVKSERLIKKSV